MARLTGLLFPALLESHMITSLKNFFARLHRDEQGAMAVEKILLLAFIALPIIVLLLVFRKWIIGLFQTQQADLVP